MISRWGEATRLRAKLRRYSSRATKCTTCRAQPPRHQGHGHGSLEAKLDVSGDPRAMRQGPASAQLKRLRRMCILSSLVDELLETAVHRANQALWQSVGVVVQPLCHLIAPGRLMRVTHGIPLIYECTFSTGVTTVGQPPIRSPWMSNVSGSSLTIVTPNAARICTTRLVPDPSA